MEKKVLKKLLAKYAGSRSMIHQRLIGMNQHIAIHTNSQLYYSMYHTPKTRKEFEKWQKDACLRNVLLKAPAF